ncbi:MAG: acyl-CoA dehydrogenase family protein [Planctomycetota bacterium]|nr:acyl-CoA dehydrogenase family protein [Planctomycetota bacterium]
MPTFKRSDQEQMEKAQDLLDNSAPGANGALGFVKSLYFGRLKMNEVLPYPAQEADEAQLTLEMIQRVQAFLTTHVDADKIDAEERIPPEVIRGLGDLGVLGMTVPKQFGGGGFSHTAYCRVLEQIGRHCASTAVMVGAHQSIGLKGLVLMGSDQQKQKFLPDLATGQKLAAFCLSEPEVGSDAANVQTSAVLSEDGKFWILNGEKKYATNSALAGMLTVMAKTPVTENGRTKNKVTAFIVTPDMSGFQVVKANRSKCGIRGTWQGMLKFVDMYVPVENVLGQVGKGLKVALGTLDYGRCTLCAGCLGGARRALEMSIDRARTRVQFGRPIAEFALIKQKIARMAETVFAMDAVTYLSAGLVDRHASDIMLETAIAKLFCSEGAWQVIDDAVQIWGGEGYMRENGLERMLRDARINRIVEGATEVMSAFVALVGMKGVGDEFQNVLRAAKHPVGNFGRLATFARSQWKDIVIGAHAPAMHVELLEESETLAGLTHQFARDVSRLLRTHREGILEMQMLQERIAWSAVDLYVSAAVLSKLQGLLDGAGSDPRSVRHDLLVGKRFCHHAAERITTRLHGLFVNHDDEILAVADDILGTKSE